MKERFRAGKALDFQVQPSHRLRSHFTSYIHRTSSVASRSTAPLSSSLARASMLSIQALLTASLMPSTDLNTTLPPTLDGVLSSTASFRFSRKTTSSLRTASSSTISLTPSSTRAWPSETSCFETRRPARRLSDMSSSTSSYDRRPILFASDQNS